MNSSPSLLGIFKSVQLYFGISASNFSHFCKRTKKEGNGNRVGAVISANWTISSPGSLPELDCAKLIDRYNAHHVKEDGKYAAEVCRPGAIVGGVPAPFDGRHLKKGLRGG
jgi:hypothetical protein